jgi:hypothetical protein
VAGAQSAKNAVDSNFLSVKDIEEYLDKSAKAKNEGEKNRLLDALKQKDAENQALAETTNIPMNDQIKELAALKAKRNSADCNAQCQSLVDYSIAQLEPVTKDQERYKYNMGIGAVLGVLEGLNELKGVGKSNKGKSSAIKPENSSELDKITKGENVALKGANPAVNQQINAGNGAPKVPQGNAGKVVQTETVKTPNNQTGDVAKETAGNISTFNPNEIRFSQHTVSYNKTERGSGVKYSYDDLVSGMKKDGWKGDPVDVVKMPDGKFTSMDNTRITAAREAGIDIKANARNFDDKLTPEETIRFSDPRRGLEPKTWGEAITGRINKQTGGFSKNNPYGANESPRITGKPKD